MPAQGHRHLNSGILNRLQDSLGSYLPTLALSWDGRDVGEGAGVSLVSWLYSHLFCKMHNWNQLIGQFLAHPTCRSMNQTQCGGRGGGTHQTGIVFLKCRMNPTASMGASKGARPAWGTRVRRHNTSSFLTFLGLFFGGLAASAGEARDGFDFAFADWGWVEHQFGGASEADRQPGSTHEDPRDSCEGHNRDV